MENNTFTIEARAVSESELEALGSAAHEARAAQEPATEDKPKRPITDYLPQTLIDMIDAAPTGQFTHAAIRGHTGLIVPDDAKDPEAIKKFITENYTPPPKPTMKPMPRRGREALIEVEISEIEHGTCRYSCSRFGTSVIPVDFDRLRECSSMDEVREMLEELIDDQVGDYSEWDRIDDYEYDDHDSNDCTDFHHNGGDAVGDFMERFREEIEDAIGYNEEDGDDEEDF